MSKSLIAATLPVAILSASADAESIHRQVQSGAPAQVWTYRNYDPIYCKDMPGVVKVVIKPAHGTISQRTAVSRIAAGPRFGSSHCIGQMSTGLKVSYRSNPGFRGTDTFTLDVDWIGHNRRETDTFTIDVQ